MAWNPETDSWAPGEPPVGNANDLGSGTNDSVVPAKSTAPQQPPGFLSDIDSIGTRGDAVQRALVGPARTAQEQQSYADRQMNDRAAKDRADMQESWNYERAAAGDPALRPWNADQERANRVRGPMEQFGSVGFIFAMAASAFTRTPMTSALNAGAAAMTAIQQGDEKAYQSAYKAWQDNSNLALKRFDMEHRLYEDANQLLTTDMNLWKQKTLMIASQFDDQKKIIMLNNGMDADVLKAQDAAAKAAIDVRKAQQGFKEYHRKTELFREGVDAWQKEHPGVNDKNPTLDYVLFKAQLMHSIMDPQRLTGVQGRVTASMDQVQRINERTAKYVSEGLSPTDAHDKAAHEIQSEDARARSSSKDKVDQALINALEKYPGMTKEDLGFILATRQPKVVSAVLESPENLEEIAKFTKEHPEALGLIAAASKRVNLDAYQALFKSDPNAAKARIDSDRDKAIDDIAKEKKLDLNQAQSAKVLQKMLTTQAFTDAALAGSRGATIYLDKAFKEIYDPTSSPGAFFSILEKRYDEADRIAREYHLGFNNRSPEALAEMPFWTGKAAGYAGKPADAVTKEGKSLWKVPPNTPGARKAKNGNWYVESAP